MQGVLGILDFGDGATIVTPQVLWKIPMRLSVRGETKEIVEAFLEEQ